MPHNVTMSPFLFFFSVLNIKNMVGSEKNVFDFVYITVRVINGGAFTKLIICF